MNLIAEHSVTSKGNESQERLCALTRRRSGLGVRTAIKAGRKIAPDQNPPPETVVGG